VQKVTASTTMNVADLGAPSAKATTMKSSTAAKAATAAAPRVHHREPNLQRQEWLLRNRSD
jgi:hypothetical protein